MKMIGLIGGMSWESTVVYYQLLNRLARQRLGGLHSARLLLWSFDFAEIEAHQAAGDWDAATNCMLDAARSLENGGAECIVICTNTMHKMAGEVQGAVNIPLIHIADATATAIKAAGVQRPLLLGTRFTMEQDFYKGHLKNQHGISVLIPDDAERTSVHDIIYQELCQGEIKPASKQRYLDIVSNAADAGADGVIFGCTEVGLLITAADLDLPAFDTTELHAIAALDFALA
ncbi:MAG: aspartate/glutamate racemase [Gammaproteobacteria bacterium]|nr:MAG: aspartate/glutamate racemase [Gammaproteobacteria bacterium]RLA37251.1 MAG: aspartate/glutamate racemase [Gammaproteobacteria bacterium]